MDIESILSVAIGFAGLSISGVLARRLYSPLMSVLAVTTIAAGSSLVFDLAAADSLAPALSLAIVAIVTAMARTEGARRWIAVLLVAAAAVALQRGGLTLGDRLNLIDPLWSSANGFFATSPALYLAGLGLIPLWRRERGLAATAVIVCLLTMATMPRGRAVSTMEVAVLVPFFVCGMAAMLDLITRQSLRRPDLVAAAAVLVLVLWNVTLAAVTRAGGHRIGEPVSFGDLGAAQAATLHDWIGHPGSYPANLIYAARHRVAPGRYDVLSPGRFFADPVQRDARIDIGADDGTFLEDGWHSAERAGAMTFRWSGRESRLLVPLDRAADLRVAATVRAFAYPGSPAQAVVLTINGRALSPHPLGAEWHTIEWTAPLSLWRAGVNRLALRFTYESRPSEVGLGGDNRLLAAAVDQIQITRQ